MNPGYYEKLLADNNGKHSLSTEEIEKDLNRSYILISELRFKFCLYRSLPEYGAYQTEEGINSLRRVLYVIIIKIIHENTNLILIS